MFSVIIKKSFFKLFQYINNLRKVKILVKNFLLRLQGTLDLEYQDGGDKLLNLIDRGKHIDILKGKLLLSKTKWQFYNKFDAISKTI